MGSGYKAYVMMHHTWNRKTHLPEKGVSFESKVLYSLSPLNKPPTDIVPRLTGAPLKEQIALFSLNEDGIPITLSASPHRSRLADIGHSVDLILGSVLPSDLSRKHDTVRTEIDLDRYIHF